MISVERSFPGLHNINGFIHGASDSLVLIQQLNDFLWDGYSIIRVSDIVECCSDKQERFFEKVLAAEGLLDQRRYDKAISLQDIRSALSNFKDSGEKLIIECESIHSVDDDEFHIGQISDLDKDSVWILEFNAEGEWEQDATDISIDRITRIQFDTPYIRIFSKYLRDSSLPRTALI